MCTHWLSQTAEGTQAAILQLLRGCRDAAELAAAESKLRAAIQNWRHTPQPESAAPQGKKLTSAAAAITNAVIMPPCSALRGFPSAFK